MKDQMVNFLMVIDIRVGQLRVAHTCSLLDLHNKVVMVLMVEICNFPLLMVVVEIGRVIHLWWPRTAIVFQTFFHSKNANSNSNAKLTLPMQHILSANMCSMTVKIGGF